MPVPTQVTTFSITAGTQNLPLPSRRKTTFAGAELAAPLGDYSIAIPSRRLAPDEAGIASARRTDHTDSFTHEGVGRAKTDTWERSRMNNYRWGTMGSPKLRGVACGDEPATTHRAAKAQTSAKPMRPLNPMASPRSNAQIRLLRDKVTRSLLVAGRGSQSRPSTPPSVARSSSTFAAPNPSSPSLSGAERRPSHCPSSGRRPVQNMGQTRCRARSPAPHSPHDPSEGPHAAHGPKHVSRQLRSTFCAHMLESRHNNSG